MPRNPNQLQLQVIAQLLAQRPVLHPAEYARHLKIHRETFNRFLPQLDAQGFLLWEDDDGRLYPCSNQT